MADSFMELRTVVSSIRAICSDISPLTTCHGSGHGLALPVETLDALVFELERTYRELVAYEIMAGDLVTPQLTEAIDSVRIALRIMRNQAENLETHLEGVRGRPRLVIPCETLQLLVEHNFTVPQMAHMLGVSPSTIHRRMTLYGLSIGATYSSLNDQELDDIVAGISHNYPMCGCKQMAGHLLAGGVRMQQSRIRESLRRVDPRGIIVRRLTVTRRRTYSVPGPLSLYHIDGNHKLIKYDILILSREGSLLYTRMTMQ